MIEELRTFLTVSAVGSIQGATRHLPLTQSAITRQIQRLESELGCTLLDRSVKPPRLTRDGEEVRTRGKLLVEEVEAFRTSFDPAAEPEGLLRLGIAHAALDWRGSSAIARAIVQLTRVYPKVTVRLSAGWTPRLVASVLDGGLDAALVLGRTGAPWPASTTAVPIASDMLVGVALPTLGVSRRTSFVDLFDRPWVLNPDGCGYRALLGALAASRQRSIYVVAEVQGASLQRELVLAGLGIGLVPESVARSWMSQRPAGNDLVIVRSKDEPLAVTAALISTDTAQRLARPIEAMGAALIDVFAGRAPDRAKHPVTS
jgi:DNA-binding transcriptional LysR family regulator